MSFHSDQVAISQDKMIFSTKVFGIQILEARILESIYLHYTCCSCHMVNDTLIQCTVNVLKIQTLFHTFFLA